MFKATPIGSCRVTEPLRLGQTHHGIDLNLARCYGYCHSPAEAVQLARFMHGTADIPKEIWSLVSPSRSRDVVLKQRHSPSDLYVVELASAKELTIDGVSIQLNYLNSTYRRFFSESVRARRFWVCAEDGDRASMSAFLDEEWSATEEQREETRMLKRIRLKYVTRKSLRRDIETLANMLPKVLFVTHVDVRKPDGNPIASRSGFIGLVCEEVARARLMCFDPTLLMAEFGQDAAIEDHSTSLAHFTQAFTHAIMDEWMHEVIAPMTDSAVRKAPSARAFNALRHQVTAAGRQGRHVQTRARFERLAGTTGRVDRLLAETNRLARQSQAAFEERVARLLLDRMEPAELSDLVLEAAALGLFHMALRLAKTGAGGLAALPAHRLLMAARLALKAGETDAAFEFAHSAFCGKRDLEPAAALIGKLATRKKIGALAGLQVAEARSFLSRLAPVKRLDALRMQGIALRAAISPDTSEKDLSEMVCHLCADGLVDEAITLMSAWRDITNIDRIRDRDLVAMLDSWVEAAMSLPTALHRVEALSTIRDADPAHAGLRNALQPLKADLIRRTRAAGKARDFGALEALRAEVEIFPAPLPEFDLWRARMHFIQGEFDKALELGQSAARHLPGTINVWVLLMRAAVKTQKAGKAAEFARNVIELASAKTQNLKSEAEAVLSAQRVDA